MLKFPFSLSMCYLPCTLVVAWRCSSALLQMLQFNIMRFSSIVAHQRQFCHVSFPFHRPHWFLRYLLPKNDYIDPLFTCHAFVKTQWRSHNLILMHIAGGVLCATSAYKHIWTRVDDVADMSSFESFATWIIKKKCEGWARAFSNDYTYTWNSTPIEW